MGNHILHPFIIILLRDRQTDRQTEHSPHDATVFIRVLLSSLCSLPEGERPSFTPTHRRAGTSFYELLLSCMPVQRYSETECVPRGGC